jgi:hypothetical protein
LSYSPARASPSARLFSTRAALAVASSSTFASASAACFLSSAFSAVMPVRAAISASFFVSLAFSSETSVSPPSRRTRCQVLLPRKHGREGRGRRDVEPVTGRVMASQRRPVRGHHRGRARRRGEHGGGGTSTATGRPRLGGGGSTLARQRRVDLGSPVAVLAAECEKATRETGVRAAASGKFFSSDRRAAP